MNTHHNSSATTILSRLSRIFSITGVLTLLTIIVGSLSGCAVVAVADAVVATTVNVGSAVINTAVDVTRAGVHAVIPNDNPKK